MKTKLLLYGVTGYTGALISRLAAEASLEHIASGRDEERVRAHAELLRLPARAFSLADASGHLSDVAVLLNCAGPFSLTAGPLVDACLATGTHYLDIAGEVPEMAALLPRNDKAKERGVMLLPGVGFGVIPTDCLAARLSARMPSATRLTLAYETRGGASQGTLRTVLKSLHREGVVRRAGALVPCRPAAKRKKIDFGEGPRRAVTNPWRADLLTASLTTGIPDIETFSVFPAPLPWIMSSSRYIGWLWGSSFFQSILERLIRRLSEGPSPEELEKGATRLWGEIEGPDGARLVSRMRGPEAYVFTARAALVVARKALADEVRAGFQTPARVFGPDLVKEIEGVEVFDD